ncbi:MAG: SusD/RagB family nutrient-binding outer membrane lipoprotein, partial [Bacteroidota bacterium]
QYADYALYNVNAGNFNTSWNNVYQGTLSQTRLIVERATEAGERHIAGIAKIIEANAIGTATERWGAVPFSEAVNIEINNPVYDGQKSGVFAALQTLLSNAIEDLNSGAGASPGSADIYFSGDRAKWIAVAHTLKARYYMDVKDYANAYTEANQGIMDPSGSMLTPHGTTNDGNLNLTYDFLVQSRSGDMDAGQGEDGAGEQVYAADLLDPSQPEYRGNAKTDETARFRYAYLDAGSNSYTGRLESNYLSEATGDSITGIVGSDAAFHMVTYMENLLTLAEAGARSREFQTGLDHLNEFRAYMSNGGYIDGSITSRWSFKYDAYESGDFESGGMANTTGSSAADALLLEILEERYLTFIATSLGWNDVRRTQSDAVRLPWENMLNRGTDFPQRLIYGQDELNSNSNAPSPVPGVFDAMEIYQ